ncbi:8-amino-7-oxononanoate synthase [Flavobacterium agrisoli]|uniref:8-amino-7-oxononanoate synthase n=1 Tax=Flavobacterium agrisoli TaxID=2793066 RepID=A0A934PLK7_9FLAO|nr:8-amino-7-oxononanoate synthase [Flavobacterium agrisoli]MBK0370422.1 8-amino-7-oxononanoate synthase [Flavobacterium agrisoli]
MNLNFTFKIFTKTRELPSDWDIIASENIFLSTRYLAVLEESAPLNMRCFFIGIFEKSELIGCAISQFLDSDLLDSYGERDKCLKTSVRNIAFKNFASRVLFLGNNMLTGQNAFLFKKNTDLKNGLSALNTALTEIKKNLKKEGKKVHITTIKDFNSEEISNIHTKFPLAFVFSTQPNMVFNIENNWKSEVDYVADLNKKYRDQYKRARKKATDLTKKKCTLNDIITLEDTIYELYYHVAKNAPFNTFFLAKNHFSVLKKHLKDDFLFYGYFYNDKLIGFNTLIKNGSAIDTYFLGYDETLQKEKMLYLNMLYDMIAYSIKKQFSQIIFARTALEIKSSVGAKPVAMFGLISHKSRLIQVNMPKLFRYFEPKTDWKERNPFK